MAGTTPTPTPAPIAIDGDLLSSALRHPTGAAGWLLQHRSGQLQVELTEALAKLLLACSENQKAGEITLRLRVQANPDDPALLVISDQVALKLPPRATAAVYLFDGDGMRLSGDEAGQLSIPLTA